MQDVDSLDFRRITNQELAFINYFIAILTKYTHANGNAIEHSIELLTMVISFPGTALTKLLLIIIDLTLFYFF